MFGDIVELGGFFVCMSGRGWWVRVCFCSFCLGFLTLQSTADDEGVQSRKGKDSLCYSGPRGELSPV